MKVTGTRNTMGACGQQIKQQQKEELDRLKEQHKEEIQRQVQEQLDHFKTLFLSGLQTKHTRNKIAEKT